MSICDLVEDGTFTTPVKGDGYSFSVSNDGTRIRWDVWADGFHRSVPKIVGKGYDLASANKMAYHILLVELDKAGLPWRQAEDLFLSVQDMPA